MHTAKTTEPYQLSKPWYKIRTALVYQFFPGIHQSISLIHASSAFVHQ
jgi:hypothetical protein